MTEEMISGQHDIERTTAQQLLSMEWNGSADEQQFQCIDHLITMTINISPLADTTLCPSHVTHCQQQHVRTFDHLSSHTSRSLSTACACVGMVFSIHGTYKVRYQPDDSYPVREIDFTLRSAAST